MSARRSPLARGAKRVAERLLGSRAAFAIGALRRKGSRLVLGYHNVIAGARPLAQGESSLHLPLENFRAQLDAIRDAGIEVVRVDAPLQAGGVPQVAITFDDAYAACLAHAVPELLSRAMPATVFVAPGLLGSAAPWWDRLADRATAAVHIPTRDFVLREYLGDGDRIIAAAPDHGWSLGEPLAEHRIGTEEELGRAMRAHPGLSLGPHTWTHPTLTRIDAARLEHELRAPHEWLRARWGDRVLDSLAYPYGVESVEVRAAAQRAGYTSALALRGDWHDRADDRFALPRYNVTPGLSVDGFRALLAGLR